jgi:hypothetical protein
MGILPALAFALLAVLGTTAAAAQTPAALPAPTNVRIENVNNPQPPDYITFPRVLRWDAVPGIDVSYQVEQLTLPPRDPSGPYEPVFTVVSTSGPGEPREYRFDSKPWRGPYCFRVVAVYPGAEFRASDQACVPKERDGGPFDPYQPGIALLANQRGFAVTWQSAFYHGEFSVQKALKPSSTEDPREADWGYASMHLNGIDGQYEFGDLGTVVGQAYCYRVRPNIEDGRWSPPACLAQPPVDGPQPPDSGNSPIETSRGLAFGPALALAGAILLLVGLANWLAFAATGDSPAAVA